MNEQVPLMVRVAASSDVGLARVVNEDSLLAVPPAFIVADGMGGHEAGDRASKIAVEEMSSLGKHPSIDDVHAALSRAAARIDALVPTDPRRAAGTTVSGVVMVEQAEQPYWLVLNLGDSRTYRMVDGYVEQISIDHSGVQELVDAGKITPSAARTHPYRNVVTRVLGARTKEEPDYWLVPIRGDERWLVCSDGLTSEVPDEQIRETMLNCASPAQAVEALIAAALAAGGHDNVSVIVVDVRKTSEDVNDMTLDDPQSLAMMMQESGGVES